MTTSRKKKNKVASITAETAERIAAAALENPSLGPDRLAQLLRREGVDVSRSLVYRTLRDRGLQTRQLRTRFLDEQGRLKEQVDSREPKKAPVPLSKHFHEQRRESPGPPVSIPGIQYDTPHVFAPAEDKPEAPAVPDAQRVEVMFRDGERGVGVVGGLRWTKADSVSDIVGYRILS